MTSFVSNGKLALVLCLAHVGTAAFLSPHTTGNLWLDNVASLLQSKDGVDMAKPPKIRGMKNNDTMTPPPLEETYTDAKLTCGTTVQVGSHSNKHEDCPAGCPFFAQNRKDADHCTFLCVPGDQCAKWNPNKPIADEIKGSKTCRGPKVAFCREPALDGTDTCVKCQFGTNLHVHDGQCYFEHYTALICVLSVVGLVGVVVGTWVLDFCCRQTINGEEVGRAQAFRSRSKILTNGESGVRHTFPINTNLCAEDVAGPGMLLHFNFQAFLIFWPLVIAITWTILACFHNELFILGTRKFGTPRSNCILVAWGYETQQRLMWTKVLFLVIVYLFSFISFLLFGVRQNRIYEQMDAKNKTMKDFTVVLEGLPSLSGDQPVEDMIKKAVATATGRDVVGVSVAWKYDDQEEVVMQAVKDDQREREIELKLVSDAPVETEAPETMDAMHKWMYNKEKGILGPDDQEPIENMKEVLSQLQTSESAFVIFRTEEDKMAALQAVEESGGIKFKHESEEHTLTFEAIECEPFTVNWVNYDRADAATQMARAIKGFTTIYLPALAIWFFVFYVPYAYAVYNFNYDNGAELPGYYGLIFTMVVVGGNATMYVVCDMCCDEMGFKFKDTKMVVYMLFYLCACMINVLLDMAVTYQTALKIMIGMDFRTYHGTRIAEIGSFTEQFESYAMQRSLAENTYAYAFPSTFLIPFLIEPIVTVLVPYQLGKLIIRTHTEVRGTCAEAYLAAFDFDLGRYADILLNVFLGILIFYFPGGYTWSLFYGMFISHIVIYVFDHWRVLKVIPTIKIVSRQVDWWAQAALGACCAMIMMVLVFKMNCESYAGYCLQTYGLLTACGVAGAIHLIVHILLLIYLVPALTGEFEDENSGLKYEEIASKEAGSFFSCNPVHCLRSKYIYKHKPHCRFLSVGKEHTLQKNTKIGLYFEDEPAPVEDWDTGTTFSDVTDTLGELKTGMASFFGATEKK